jgi:hypothetical protein
MLNKIIITFVVTTSIAKAMNMNVNNSQPSSDHIPFYVITAEDRARWQLTNAVTTTILSNVSAQQHVRPKSRTKKENHFIKNIKKNIHRLFKRKN